MSQSVSPLKKSVTGWIFAALVALGLALYYLVFQQSPTAPAPQTQTERTKTQAMKTLMALPELKLWSSQIEKGSGGKLRGALIEYDPKPSKTAPKWRATSKVFWSSRAAPRS